MNETRRGRTRVVVTGLGAITPAGKSVAEFWDNLVAGRSGIAALTMIDPAGFPCKIAGEVKDWDPTEFIEVGVFGFDEVLRMVERSEIRDAMTVIAVLHAARRLGR